MNGTYGFLPILFCFIICCIIVSIIKKRKRKAERINTPIDSEGYLRAKRLAEKAELPKMIDAPPVQNSICAPSPYRVENQQTEVHVKLLTIAEFRPISKAEYIVFDTETTGLNSEYDTIVEIAAVRVKNAEIVDTFHSLVNPERKMPDAVVRINHITDEMLAGQPIIQDVLPFFLEFVGDCVLVAHNARFDASFLAQACMRNRYKVPNQFFDSMELARYYPEAKNKKQDTLLRCAGISNSLAHRALGDAQSLAQFVILTFKQEKQRKEQIQNDELARIIITDTDRRLFNVQCPVEDILNKDDWDKGFQQGSPYYFQGEVLRKSGRLEDALILYNKARYMGYNAPALYRSYAMCYRKMKQYDNEISIIDEFLERNPGEKEDQFQERKEKAIQLLQKQQSIS